MSEDFFGDLGKTISKAATEVVDKTGEFIEATKIKSQISTEQRAMEKGYRDIGEIIYNMFQDGNAFGENVASICQDVESHQEQITAYKKELADIKGLKICGQCQELVDKNATFCPKCGSAVEEEVVDTVDNPETVADAETVADQVADAAETAKDTVADAAEDVVDAAKETAEDAVNAAKDAVEQAKEAMQPEEEK